MMEQISPRQFTILTVLFTIGTSLLVIPSQLATDVEQDTWIGSIIACLFDFAYLLLYIKLLNKYPDQSFIQIIEAILGKWIGKAVSWVYIIFFIMLTIFIVKFLGDFIKTMILPATPPWFIYLSFLLVVVIALRYGVETIARSAELFFPIVIVFLSIIMVMLIKDSDINNIKPVGEHGIMAITVAGLKMSPFQEHICLLMLIPFVKRNGKYRANRSLLVGTMIGSIFLIVFSLFTILILGNYNTANMLYPVFIIVQKISIGDFFQRIEVLMIAVWFLAVFIKSCIIYHSALTGISHTMNIKDCKPLILPLGVVIAVFSNFIYQNTASFLTLSSEGWFTFALIYLLLIPLLLLVIDWIKSAMTNKDSFNLDDA